MAAVGFNPFWHDDPDLWDTVTLGGHTIPGRTDVETEVEKKVKKKRAAGRHGGRSTDKGDDLATVKLVVTIWTPEHFNAWEELLPKIHPHRQDEHRVALEIIHPSLSQLRINRVYVKGVSNLRKGSEVDTMTATITCIEFRPPDNTNATRGVREGQNSRSRQPNMVFEFESADADKSRTDPQVRSPANAGGSEP
jgi:hypothetical protein